MSQHNWNQIFTSLIRQDNKNLWGNWGLSDSVRIGAVGKISGDGQFTHYLDLGSLKAEDIDKKPPTFKWQVRSKGTKKTDNQVSLGGGCIDPSTGVKVDAGIETSWTFSEDLSVVSEMAIARVEQIKNIDEFVKQYYQKMFTALEQVEGVKAENKGILQGYGFISKVIYASSGVNIASYAKNTSFSITGTADATHALLGDGGKLKTKASYISEKASESVNALTWPSDPNTVVDELVPIAYEFCSFADSNKPILAWTGLINSLQLNINSVSGCTYIVRCHLTYQLPNKSQRHSEKFSVSGGLSHNIGLPLNAEKVKLDLSFVGVMSNQDMSFEWAYPLRQWRNGRCQVNLQGVWPGKAKANEV